MRAMLCTGLALAARWRSAAPARGAGAADAGRRQGRADRADGQIEQLRDELVRSGAAGGLPAEPATALTRLDQLEAELRRLTDRVDVLTNDVDPHRRGRDATGSATSSSA